MSTCAHPLITLPPDIDTSSTSSSATAGYCSQCFKTKNGAAATPAKAAAASTGPGSPSLPPLHSSASAAASMAAASSASGAAASGKEVQANRSRCWKCKKKVGLLGFHCPCDYSFCSKCRYPEEHSCPHDFMKGMSLPSRRIAAPLSHQIVSFMLDLLIEEFDHRASRVNSNRSTLLCYSGCVVCRGLIHAQMDAPSSPRKIKKSRRPSWIASIKVICPNE